MSLGDTKTISDIVGQVMLRNMKQGPIPHAYRRQIEAQKIVIEMFFEEILKEIGRGNRVRIKNFATFEFRVLNGPVKNFYNSTVEEPKYNRRLKVRFSKNTVTAINNTEE